MNFVITLLLLVQIQGLDEENYGVKVKPRVDYDAGLVYYEKWVDSLYLGVDSVSSLKAYLASAEKELSHEAFLDKLREKSAQNESQEVEGIIPNINIQMGKEKTEINISGQDKIILGTSISKRDKDTAVTVTPVPKQELNVSVKGTIARKTEVLINHNSVGDDFFNNNKVRLSYKGDEDEIVKKIEAGDVSLNLPSVQTNLSHQGLFGINGQFKLGPVDLYAVASREQAQGGVKEYNGITERFQGDIQDYDFSSRKYFYVFYDSLRSALANMNDSVVGDFLVYGTDEPANTDLKWRGTVSTNPGDTASVDEKDKEENTPLLYLYQEGVDYILRNNTGNRLSAIIELNSTLSDGSILAIECTTKVAGKIGTSTTPYPHEDSSGIANFLIVWGSTPDSTRKYWNNMVRNRYYMPGSFSDLNQIYLKILRYDSDEPDGYIEYNADSVQYSDLLGMSDSNIHTLKSIEKELGYLVFDQARPFLDKVLGADTIRDIYYKTNITQGKYIIRYDYYALTRSFSLTPFLLDSSVTVKVKYGGTWQTLKEGTDFTVEPDAGIVTLNDEYVKTNEAALKTALIRITYESKTLFALDTKSLLGVRAESELLKGVKLGADLLFRAVGYSSDAKPTLGMEPFSRTVGDVDLSVERKLDFLTKWIDRLPLVTTETPSKFNMVAYSSMSIPNPNTHQSNSVWVEDFEQGILETHTVGLGNIRHWYPTSKPVGMDTALYSRNRPRWYLSDSFEPREEIYGEDLSNVPVGSRTTDQAFVISWKPEASENWSGIIGGSVDAIPLDITEAQNLEIILKPGNAKGVMHFDFGSEIDQDQLRLNKSGEIVGLGKLDTEDPSQLYETFTTDIGLDYSVGADSANVEGDDGNDDCQMDVKKSRYNPNGTEGNGYLDTEELRHKGFSSKNAYMEFDLDLQDEEFFANHVEHLGTKGWIRVSVPVKDSSFYKKIGEPNTSSLSLFRIWFEGMQDSTNIEIYSWKFQGNKWRNPRVFADNFTPDTLVDSLSEHVFIDLIGTRTDTSYTPPFALKYNSNNEKEEDNSLKMTYDSLALHHATAVTRTDYQSSDFRSYQRIKFYVHNDTNYLENDPSFYFRMGSDSTAYYEIRTPISKGTTPSGATSSLWKEFIIDLSDLVDLKVELKDSMASDSLIRIRYSQDSNLVVKGLPSFSRIKYFQIGIINDSKTTPISGQVWFDDIRLEGPYREIGSKIDVSADLALADVGRVTGSYTTGDGKFVDFASAQGPRTTGSYSNYALGSSINLDKFGIEKLGFKLPVNAGLSHSEDIPRYMGETPDQIVDSSKIDTVRGRRDDRNISFSLSHPQSRNRIMQYLLDGITGSTSFKSSGSETDAGLAVDTSFSENYAVAYRLAPDLSFKLFKEEIHYAPNSINLSANFDKTNSGSLRRTSTRTPWPENTTWTRNTALTTKASTSFTPIKYLPLSADFTETRAVNSDRSLPEVLLGDEYYRNLNLSAPITGISFGSFGSPSISTSSGFIEDHSASLRKQFEDWYEDTSNTFEDFPNRVLYDTAIGVRNLQNNSSIRLGWSTFDLHGMIKKAKDRTLKRKEEREKMLDSLMSSDTLANIGLEPELPLQDSLQMNLPAGDTSQDTLDAQAPKVKRSLLEILENATKIIQPVSVGAAFGRSTGYNWYVDDFSWKENFDYVIGINQDLNARATYYKPSVSKGTSQSYNASTGVVFGPIRIDGSAKYTYSENNEALNRYNYNKSWTFPELRASYNDLGKLLEKVAVSSQLTSAFVLTKNERGIRTPGDINTPEDTTITNGTFQMSLSPLLSWNTSWKERVTSSVSVNYSIARDTTYLNSDSLDKIANTTETRGAKVSVGYTFNKPSGFKLGFLKHLKFKNDLTLTGTLDYSQTIQYIGDKEKPAGDTTKNPTISTTTGSIQGKYTFSEAFDGGLDISLSRFKNTKMPTADYTDFKVDLFVVFRF